MPGFSVHCVATISHRDFGQDCAAVASDVHINNRVVSKGTSGELQGEFSETESPWSFVSIDEPEGENHIALCSWVCGSGRCDLCFPLPLRSPVLSS